MNPAKWHACAAFVASGLEHASASAPARAPTPSRDQPERTLTRALRVFDVDCVEFFRSLRKFMSAGAATLAKRLDDAKKSSGDAPAGSGGKPERTRRRAGKETAAEAGEEEAAREDEDSDARRSTASLAGLESLEAALSVPELRTSFAFTRVAAQKYKLFADVHLDASGFAGGADVARFGWRMFLAAKHSTLPKFPDLFSLYHALVAAEAFLLVNAPRGALRTDVANMVSVAAGAAVDEKTKSKTVDVLAGLAASSKTKLPTLRLALEDLEREVLVGSLNVEPVPHAPDSAFAETGPRAFKGVFGDGGAAAAAAAAAEAKDAYASAARKSGLAWHLRLDEGLYFALGAEEEAEAKRVLGDVGAAGAAGAGVAATPRPGGQAGVPSTPWRGAGTMRFVLGASPARLGSKAAYSPYPASRLGGGAGGVGSAAAAAAAATAAPVPFTPVSEAMASASWLHGIVSASGGGAASLPPASRLERFLGAESAAKLVETVHGLAGKTSAALREDAFLVTINGVAALAGAGHNVSLDNLVKRRQEEAVRVFAYFAEGVFEGEHRRSLPGGGKSALASDEIDAKSEMQKNQANFAGVADVASLAASVAPTTSATPAVGNAGSVVVPDPDESAQANFRALAGSSRFVRAVLACAMEVVVASYKTATLKFPAIPRLLGLDAFDVVGIIEPFVRADPTMPREVKKHFNAIEERVMETMAWQRGSSLFGFLRAAESGAPPLGSRPAAAALAAVSKRAPAEAGASPRRAPSFSSVAGIAAAAAEGASGADEEPPLPASDTRGAGAAGTSKSGSFDEDDVTPPRRKQKAFDAEATTRAFSTPVRGSTTPSRPARRDSGAAASLSAAGVGGAEPLPRRFVREPVCDSPGDATARNSLRVFFAKVMRTSARRLADLCERLHLPQELTKAAYDLTSVVLYDHTSLLYNRHLDQILLCAVYGVCKVNSARGSLLEERQVTFRDIIACYHKQPQCREETFWTVSLEQTDPELEVTRRGDVIQFYNQVFVPEVKSRLLALKTNSSSGSGGSGNGVTTGGGNGGVVSAINHSQLRSPRRALPGNSSAPRSVYVSPMRSSAAAAAQMAHMTPRSKSLFAFVGESTHAYQSPGRDLQFINQRINDAAKAKKTNEEAGVATVAGVAAAIAPPSTSGRKSTRALAFEDGSGAPRGGGEEDARPPKAPRR